MPDTKEKLIELLAKKLVWGVEFAAEPKRIENEELADYLVAHGVTVQKHGRWVDRTRYIYGMPDFWIACSVCGRQLGDFHPHEFDYCPYCGAKMDGGADNG